MDFSALDTQQKPAIFPIEFTTEYEKDPDDPSGSKMIAKDWVRWGKKGTSNGATTRDKVDRLKKGSVEWAALEPYYDAWKKNQEAPIDGTPLDAWPGLTVPQAKVLRSHNLRSVEDFATAPDSVLTRMAIPGIRELQRRAKAFCEAAEGQAAIAEAMAKRDDQIDQLTSQLADAMKAIEALKQDAPPKRGPGRPRKED